MTAHEEIAQMANHLVNALHRLAETIDPDYAEECAESSCTNEEPTHSNDKVIRHLIHTAQMINASGLCDLWHEAPCMPCFFRRHPLNHQWYI